mmetsp:Transcript_15587/g.28333  ORF Transcript_15587/g.28333 Transcript_15587/m.28333 type:complete len:423 (+) Transcript_15587:1366-2634(+)
MVNKAALSTCIGAFMVTTASSSFQSWGIVNLYICSFFHNIDPSNTVYTASWTYTLGIFCIGIGQNFTPFVVEKFGPRRTCFVGGCIVALGYLLCSMVTSLALFIVFYGTLVGFGSGLNFMLGSNVVAKYFTTHRGKVIGIIATGQGFGMVFCALFFALYCNPSNKSPDVEASDSEVKYFGPDVTDNVPSVFKWMALLCFAMFSVGGLLLIPPSLPTSEEEVELLSAQGEDETFKDILKSAKFWKLFLLLHIGMFSGIWINLSFKNFGSLYIENDHLLAYIGGVGGLLNGVARGLFPFLIDYINFYTINISVIAVLCFIDFVYYYSVGSAVLFSICSVVALFLLGSHFFPFSILCMREYGTIEGPKVFSFLGWAANICGILIGPYYALVGLVGFHFTYTLQGLMCLGALYVSYSLRKKDICNK